MIRGREVYRLAVPVFLAFPALLAAAGWLTPAQGNLAPPATHEAILFHVQPVSAGFCDQDHVWECPQVRQHTEATGLLEFDLFVYSNRPEEDLSLCTLDLPLAWPAEWTLIDWECCHEGEASFAVSGHAGQLSIAWQSCPDLRGGLLLVARFIMDVEGCGWFGVAGVLDHPTLKLTRGSQELDIWWVLPGWAQAGVTCSYCYIPCDLHTPCRPELTPRHIELETCLGGTAQGYARCWMHGGCEAAYATTADWLEVEVGDPVPASDGITQEILIRADATSLPVGTHEAYIRASGECVGCTRLILSVIPTPPVSIHTSWGKLKDLYR
ncbi:MAG: hypothetical protein KAY32_07330 [Candidatus Eisenbacteria sp.]|nr:hypothetical protein [Candidatus Eisenbacteria bacterium]